MQWPRDMAVLDVRRKSLSPSCFRSASDHLHRLRAVVIHVIGQHVCCACCPLHRSRRPVLHRDGDRGNMVVWMFIPNVSIDNFPISRTQWSNREIISKPVSAQSHLGRLYHVDELPVGARLGIPLRPQHPTISIVLEDRPSRIVNGAPTPS